MQEQRTIGPGGHGPAAGFSQPVLLIPGFLCGDESLRTLAGFLEAIGHHPHPSGIVLNVDCSEAAVSRLAARVVVLAEHYEQPVALVGHSRGGLFAHVVAHRCPDLVSGIVTLGAPRRDPWQVHPALWAQALGVAMLAGVGVPGLMSPTCGLVGCCARFWRELSAPLPHGVGLLSIYSRRDQMVNWRACLDPDGHHVEVTAGHYAMPGHAPTLGAVGSALATFYRG